MKVNGVEIEGSGEDVVAYVSLLGAKAPDSPEPADTTSTSARSLAAKKAHRKRKLKAARELRKKQKDRELKKAGVSVAPKPISAERRPGKIKLAPKPRGGEKAAPVAIPDSHAEGGD